MKAPLCEIAFPVNYLEDTGAMLGIGQAGWGSVVEFANSERNDSSHRLLCVLHRLVRSMGIADRGKGIPIIFAPIFLDVYPNVCKVVIPTTWLPLLTVSLVPVLA